MNFVAVLISAAILCVLDAAPVLRSEEQDHKRGGVSSALQGSFHKSVHHPLFARAHHAERRNWNEGQDKQKKTTKEKKFNDILGTSWGSTQSWGQSDPWGNSWGDPWGDDSYSYSYYYVPWPRLSKRGKGAKTKSKKGDNTVDRFDRDYLTTITGMGSHYGGHSNTPSWAAHFDIQNQNYYYDNNDEECAYCCYDYDDYCYSYCYDFYYYNCDDYYSYGDYDKVKKDMTSNSKGTRDVKKGSVITEHVKDKKTDKRIAEKTKHKKYYDAVGYDPWGNPLPQYGGYSYPSYGYVPDPIGYDPWGNPLQYSSYSSPGYGYIPDAPGYDPWGNPLGKHKKAMKQVKDKKRRNLGKDKKEVVATEHVKDKKTDKRIAKNDKQKRYHDNTWVYPWGFPVGKIKKETKEVKDEKRETLRKDEKFDKKHALKSWYYGGYYPGYSYYNYYSQYIDPYYYIYYYDVAKDKKARSVQDTDKTDKLKRKSIADGSRERFNRKHDKKGQYYLYGGYYYPGYNTIDQYSFYNYYSDPYQYYYYYNIGKEKKARAIADTDKADKDKRMVNHDGSKKESQLMSAIKRFMDEPDDVEKK